MRALRVAFISMAGALLLSGCALFSGSQQSAPLPPEEAVQSLPTITPTALPTPFPSLTPAPQTGQAGPGEILFVRDGQIWAIYPDGTNERPLTLYDPGSVLRALSNSPDGRYLAYTLNGQSLQVFDLPNGSITTVAEIPSGSLNNPVWSADSSSLYYQALIPEGSEIGTIQSQIWQVAMPPGSAAPVLRDDIAGEEGVGLKPLFDLGDGRLLVGEVRADSPGRTLQWSGGGALPLGGGQVGEGLYGVWDVSPDHSRALLSEQVEGSPGGPLYIVSLVPPESSVASLMRVTAADDPGVYLESRFAPDGVRIVTLRYVPAESGVRSDARAQVVLLQPGEDGTYQGLTLSPDETADTLAFAWHSEIGIVAQRWVLASNQFELWLLPLDGSPGQMLTTGEQPVVVGGR